MNTECRAVFLDQNHQSYDMDTGYLCPEDRARKPKNRGRTSSNNKQESTQIAGQQQQQYGSNSPPDPRLRRNLILLPATRAEGREGLST